jgi:hypothetical protein
VKPTFSVLFGLLASAACTSEAVRPRAEAHPPLDSADSVRSAAVPLLIRLSEENMGGLSRAVAYCLTLNAPVREGWVPAPPSDGLVAALQANRPPIVNGAECTGMPGDLAAPGVRGRAWWIWADVDSLGDEIATVQGGYNAGPLLAAGWTCRLKRSLGGWIAPPSCSMDWVS